MACHSVTRSTHQMPLERQTFQSLYQEQLGPIYRSIYSKAGNRKDAEDLTSQVFLKAARGLDGERGIASMRQWLFRVARNTVADYWRAWYGLPAASLEALLTAGWAYVVCNEMATRACYVAEEHPQHFCSCHALADDVLGALVDRNECTCGEVAWNQCLNMSLSLHIRWAKRISSPDESDEA